MKWSEEEKKHNKSDNNGMWREHDLSLWTTIIFTVYTHSIHTMVIENYVWWHGWLFANQFDILHTYSHKCRQNEKPDENNIKMPQNEWSPQEWMSERHLCIRKIEIAWHTQGEMERRKRELNSRTGSNKRISTCIYKHRSLVFDFFRGFDFSAGAATASTVTFSWLSFLSLSLLAFYLCKCV